jgi:hypothetical protein
MRGPTRSAHTHTRARIGGAVAHNGPRRIDDPAERVPPAVARRRAEKAAHTEDNVVTAAVFHAPMFALNADAYWNACAPSHERSAPTGTRSHGSARMPNRTRTRARARTQHVRACVRRARIGDPFIGVASRAWI